MCQITKYIYFTKNEQVFETISILLMVLTITLIVQKWSETSSFLVKIISPHALWWEKKIGKSSKQTDCQIIGLPDCWFPGVSDSRDSDQARFNLK